MLVCVKTLVEAPSFHDVRNSKEWLTTSETWDYIVQHSAAATMMLWEGGSSYINDEDKGWNERWKIAKMLQDGLRRGMRWGTPYRMIYSWIPHTTTKDNSGANVKFFNIADINSVVETWEKDESERQKRIIKKRKARLLEALGRSAAANKNSKYNEPKISEVTLLRDNYYDPEWF